MKFVRSVVLLLAVFLVGSVFGAASDDASRLEQVDDQIRVVQELLGSLTSESEKATYARKLELLNQERDIVLRRSQLRQREESLAGRFNQNTKLRLHDFLSTVEDNPAGVEGELVVISQTIKSTLSDRSGLEKEIAALSREADAKKRSELEMNLDVLAERLRAERFVKRSLEFRLRLIQEAERIRSYLEQLPVNPRPSTRSMLETRRYVESQHILLSDTEVLLETVREQKAQVWAERSLSGAQLKALDEEISVLEDKLSGINRLLQKDELLSRARAQKRLMGKKSAQEEAQLIALDQSLSVLVSTSELYDRNGKFLVEYTEVLSKAYLRRVVIPVGTILGIFLFYLVLSRAVFPFFFERDELFNARRLGGYLVGIASLVVMSIYFLDDLQAIATVFGIAGAALVIALQDLLSAVAGWFVIVSSRKIRVGDRVEVNGRRGDIIDIQLLRTTMVELNEWLGVDQPTGRIVVLPNSYIFKDQVVNYSHMHRYLWGAIDVLITYESSMGKAREVLASLLEEECADDFAAAKLASRDLEQKYGVADSKYESKIYTTVEDSGILFKLLYVSHYKQFSATRSRISKRIAEEFEATEGIEFAYPTMRYIPTAEPSGFDVNLKS